MVKEEHVGQVMRFKEEKENQIKALKAEHQETLQKFIDKFQSEIKELN